MKVNVQVLAGSFAVTPQSNPCWDQMNPVRHDIVPFGAQRQVGTGPLIDIQTPVRIAMLSRAPGAINSSGIAGQNLQWNW